MKLIIAGSRDFNFYANEKTNAISTYYIDTFLDILGIRPTEVVCGCGGTEAEGLDKAIEDGYIVSSGGIDRLGEYWADAQRLPIKRIPAEWKKLGRSAGPIRNAKMAEYGDALLLIWDGESRGSANMKLQMQKLNKPVYEIVIKEPPAKRILFGVPVK